MTKSYVIWNNKGGVGKSTITFHIACSYAEKHPEEDIVIIDMCPQANVSMMLLGGGKKGEKNLQELISLDNPKTVVGFISDSLIGEANRISDYLIPINSKNDKLPNNLYLLSGDGNLELIAPFIAKRAEIDPISERDKPWKKVISLLKNVTEKNLHTDKNTTFFIDTNPSFSIYTQIGIVAGDSLLVPINADDSYAFGDIHQFSV